MALELLSKSQLKSLSKKSLSALTEYNNWKEYDSDLVELMNYISPLKMAVHSLPYLEENNSLLDVGCGTGLNGFFYKKYKDCRITGIDISDKSLIQASKKRFGRKKVYKNLKQANLENKFDFEDNSFDATLCVGVFEYFRKMDHVISEMVRVSNDLVVFNFPTTKPPYLNSHSRKDAMKILEENDLELLEEFRYHAWTTGYGKSGTKRIFTRGMIARK